MCGGGAVTVGPLPSLASPAAPEPSGRPPEQAQPRTPLRRVSRCCTRHTRARRSAGHNVRASVFSSNRSRSWSRLRFVLGSVRLGAFLVKTVPQTGFPARLLGRHGSKPCPATSSLRDTYNGPRSRLPDAAAPPQHNRRRQTVQPLPLENTARIPVYTAPWARPFSRYTYSRKPKPPQWKTPRQANSAPTRHKQR